MKSDLEPVKVNYSNLDVRLLRHGSRFLHSTMMTIACCTVSVFVLAHSMTMSKQMYTMGRITGEAGVFCLVKHGALCVVNPLISE